jgi:alpha-beta hydrolase superfamily lysophospholipase
VFWPLLPVWRVTLSDINVPEPLFLSCDPDPVLATLHRPDGAGHDTAVLVCPPFGWEEVCSYRSLRRWAELLAQRGYATLRCGLPGTGDSGGGPRDDDRLGAWVAAVSDAAGWLASTTGARRLVAVGIGSGGLVACLAAAGGAAIDDLALWGTPARGRAMIRQLRAFSTLERAHFYEGIEPGPAPREGELEAGGFVLTAETVAAIDAVDLRELTLPGPVRRHALLMERDGLAVDAGLRDRLEVIGVTVSLAPGPGYADMTSDPQTARPPLAVIDRVTAWLDRLSDAPEGAAAEASAPGTTVPAAGPSTVIPAAGGGVPVRETVLTLPGPSGQLVGVLAEPTDPAATDLCVVLLNAGAVRRIGPSRMAVEAARRWAARGTPVLRLDLEAIGDSDGDETPYRDDAGLYGTQFVPQVIAAIDYLQERGVGRRFVLGGLCSGAYWSFHAARVDERIPAVLLLNPRALVWDAGLGPGRDLRALVTQRPSLAKIRRLATGPRLHALLRWLAALPIRFVRQIWLRESQSAINARQLERDLDRMLSSGKRMLLLFSEYEPLERELARAGGLQRLAAAPGVTLARVGVRDHTMRPGWAQREVHQALDRALASELAPTAPVSGSPSPA